MGEHLQRLQEAFEYFDPEGDWASLERRLASGLRTPTSPPDAAGAVVYFRDSTLDWHYGLDIVPEEEIHENLLKVCWANSLRGVPLHPPTIKLGFYCEADEEKRRAARRVVLTT